ncbi:MAG TPA: SIMPL domain-containing protein [Solimonas sp.]|nr:SIMPL domain-containing protein [Solimonas sp.]
MNKLAACLFPLALLGPIVAHAHDEGALRRSVAVSGQGEVLVKPDRARLSIAVDAFNKELKAAEAEVNKVVRAYLVEAKALGTRDEDISTAGITVSPEYSWDEPARRQFLTGYRARRDIEVMITDLDKLGDYVLRATKVGINNVSSPTLESSKAREVQREALVRATQDARAKAQLLADTLGVKLGAIHSISASDSYAPPPMPMKAMAMREQAADSGNQQMGFAAGQIKYSAMVNADFDLQ